MSILDGLSSKDLYLIIYQEYAEDSPEFRVGDDLETLLVDDLENILDCPSDYKFYRFRNEVIKIRVKEVLVGDITNLIENLTFFDRIDEEAIKLAKTLNEEG